MPARGHVAQQEADGAVAHGSLRCAHRCVDVRLLMAEEAGQPKVSQLHEGMGWRRAQCKVGHASARGHHMDQTTQEAAAGVMEADTVQLSGCSRAQQAATHTLQMKPRRSFRADLSRTWTQEDSHQHVNQSIHEAACSSTRPAAPSGAPAAGADDDSRQPQRSSPLALALPGLRSPCTMLLVCR